MVSNLARLVKTYQSDIILAIGVAMISLLSFGVGFLVAREHLKEPVTMKEPWTREDMGEELKRIIPEKNSSEPVQIDEGCISYKGNLYCIELLEQK